MSSEGNLKTRGSPTATPSTSSENEDKGFGDRFSDPRLKVLNGDRKEPISDAQIEAQAYLSKKKILELFNFLFAHLLVDEPEDPVEYLTDLLDKCVLFRNGFRDAPILFSKRHIESMFQNMDITERGCITLDQYESGMKALGITCYERQPVESVPGCVDKQTFLTAAEKGLEDSLMQILKMGNFTARDRREREANAAWVLSAREIQMHRDMAWCQKRAHSRVFDILPFTSNHSAPLQSPATTAAATTMHLTGSEHSPHGPKRISTRN